MYHWVRVEKGDEWEIAFLESADEELAQPARWILFADDTEEWLEEVYEVGPVLLPPS